MNKILYIFISLTMILFAGNPIFGQANCGGGSTGGGAGTSTSGGSLVGGASYDSFNSMNTLQFARLQSIMSQSYELSSLQYEDFKGSPYLFDDFQKGYVVFNDGEEIQNVDLNYDAYTKDIIAKDEKGETIALDERFYKKVVIVAHDEEFITFEKINPLEKDAFYQVLYNENGVAFYKDHKASVREAENKGVAVIPGRILMSKKYYLQKDGEKPVAIKLNKKTLLSQFDGIQKVALEEKMKTKKLKMKKESDYIQVLTALQE